MDAAETWCELALELGLGPGLGIESFRGVIPHMIFRIPHAEFPHVTHTQVYRRSNFESAISTAKLKPRRKYSLSSMHKSTNLQITLITNKNQNKCRNQNKVHS